MKAFNVSQNKEISSKVERADTLIKRMKGLLGREGLEEGESLWLQPCISVHTIGMKFSIDVVFLDKNNIVVGLRKNLAPNRLTRIFLTASSVLELKAGVIETGKIRIGDGIDFTVGQ